MAGQNSINTNIGAMVALRNLNTTSSELKSVQDRVSSGLRVIGAKDNASTFAIAQGIRGDIKANGAVQQGLSQGKGIASVAMSGATAVSNILIDIKAKIIEGLNPANTTAQQAILQADYTELVGQVLNFIQNAEFNGQNMLKSGGTAAAIIADKAGGALTIRTQDLEATAYSQINVQTLTNSTSASAALTQINTVINTVNTALGQLGADNRALDNQDKFLSSIQDALDEGLGALVDADLAKESARLQSLQVKQQLSVQTLSIANSSPQILLGLFN